MIVMKFGGTSLADAGRIRRVAALVSERADRRPLVVVSALAGVTNQLVETAALAEAGDESALQALLETIAERHAAVLRDLGFDATNATTLSMTVAQETVLTFPDGQTITIDDPSPCQVILGR